LSMQRGLLRRGKTQLTFSATTSLSHGVFDENSSQLALDLHLENAVVEEWLALAGQDYPLTGVLGADLRATGTVQNLRGSGNLRIAKLTVYKEPFQSFRSQLQFAKTEVQLSNILLAHNGAQLTGSAAYDLRGESFRFDLTGSGIELAELQKW